MPDEIQPDEIRPDQIPPGEIPPQPPYTNVPYTEVPGSGYPPPPPGYTPPPASGLSENAASALSYLTIIPAILFLVLEPYNRMPLVRFHSIQCLALAVVAMAAHLGVSAAAILLHFIPLSWVVFAFLQMAVTVLVFIAWLVAIIQASKGVWYKLPVIGDFAERQARR